MQHVVFKVLGEITKNEGVAYFPLPNPIALSVVISIRETCLLAIRSDTKAEHLINLTSFYLPAVNRDRRMMISFPADSDSCPHGLNETASMVGSAQGIDGRI